MSRFWYIFYPKCMVSRNFTTGNVICQIYYVWSKTKRKNKIILTGDNIEGWTQMHFNTGTYKKNMIK